MHNSLRLCLALALTLAFVTPALAQQPKPKGGFPGGGGGFGGFGGPGANSPLALINNPKVREELKLSDEQVEQIPDAMLKALADVLQPAQMKRLQQIQFQQRGINALMSADIQKKLSITDDQMEGLETIMKDAGQEMKELFDSIKDAKDFKARQETMEKVAQLRKERDERMTKVLTSSQRQMWQDMVGEAFELGRGGPGGFGGFGGFGGPGGKKKPNDNN